MSAIETHNLRKHYGATAVLHDLNLLVPAGSVFGFLGPNGAGKTTTIRILLGLLRASGGAARVLGHEVWHEGPRLRAAVGYLPGDVRFYDALTGRKTLAFFNRARGGGHDREIQRLAQRFELNLDKPVRSYSRGMKQKLGLIQALFHRPRLLILDEPTTALDPLVRQTLCDELRSAAGAGRTVLFSSHTLSEVEEICDRVAILRGGRLIEQSTIDDLRDRALRHVELTLHRDRPLAAAPPGLTIESRVDGRVSATWAGPIDALIAWLATGGIRDVTIQPPSLEDLFLAYYGDGAEPRRLEPRPSEPRPSGSGYQSATAEGGFATRSKSDAAE